MSALWGISVSDTGATQSGATMITPEERQAILELSTYFGTQGLGKVDASGILHL